MNDIISLILSFIFLLFTFRFLKSNLCFSIPPFISITIIFRSLHDNVGILLEIISVLSTSITTDCFISFSDFKISKLVYVSLSPFVKVFVCNKLVYFSFISFIIFKMGSRL